MTYFQKLLIPFLSLICTNAFAVTDCPKSQAAENPSDVLAKDAEARLLNRDFPGLEALAAAYRNPMVVASDGQPKLQALYARLSEADHACKNVEPEQAWLDRKQLIDEWNHAEPASVAAKLAAANFVIRYAWHARGSGYAGTVSDEGWKHFAERAAQARSMLEQPSVKAEHNPAWYAAMMRVALMQSWSAADYDKLYAEAVGRYPLYYDYYFQRALYYSPKWNGEEGDLDKVAADAVKRTHKQIGEAAYARIHWALSNVDQFTNGQTDWKHMKKGFEDMVASYPDAWNRNNFAMFACRAGDWATFKDQAALFGDKPMPRAWNGVDGYYWCKANAQKRDVADPTKPVLYQKK